MKLANAQQRIQTVNAWQPYVGYQKIQVLLMTQAQGVLAALDGEDLVAFIFQTLPNHGQQLGIVLQ